MSLIRRSFDRRSSTIAIDSQEIEVLREAGRFRLLAEGSWDDGTVHPSNEFIPGKSDGHCGVTNFGFGVWLALKGTIESRQLFYEEGRIVRPNNESVGDHHAILRAIVDDGCQRPDLIIKIDLAGDQFSVINAPVVVQYEEYFYPDEKTASGSHVYVADRVTPLAEYDVTRFNSRLGRFMLNVGNLADPAVLPPNYEEGLQQWGLVVTTP